MKKFQNPWLNEAQEEQAKREQVKREQKGECGGEEEESVIKDEINVVVFLILLLRF